MRRLLLFLFFFLLTSCTTERYGAGIDKNAPKVLVKDVILNPAYLGKTVNLEGKITTQCASSGCWFFLRDDSGQIFVDLSKNDFSLPPRQGKKAKVTGIVSSGEAGIFVIAVGLEIR